MKIQAFNLTLYHKTKVRDKHQKNVRCIQFIFITEVGKPTIVRLAIS